MPSLFELNSAYEEAMNLYESGCEEVVDTETGEIIPIYQYLSQLELDRETKIDNTVLYLKALDYDQKALKEEIQRLKERMEAKAKRAEGLRNYLSTVLDGQKRETAQYRITYRRSESVDVHDVSKLAKKYVVEKTTVVPDKAAIKQAIKAGEVVEGAQIVVNLNMNIK